MFVMPLRHAACTLGSQVLQPNCASKQLCTALSNQKMVADISHHPPDQYLTCTAEISDRCSNCGELVLQEAMELNADQKARIVTNRRRLLLRLEALIQRQSAAVEVLQENMPLQVRAHAGTCAHAVFCATCRAKHVMCQPCLCILPSSKHLLAHITRLRARKCYMFAVILASCSKFSSPAHAFFHEVHLTY